MAKRKGDIVLDAVRRFPHLQTRTLASYILNVYGDLFDNDLEKVRDSVRYYRGTHGKANKKTAGRHAALFTDTPVRMPDTWRRKRTKYKLPTGVGLILSDAHVPFHEIKPLEAAIQDGQAEKAEWIFLNGDWMDCAAVSFWPTAHRDFNREVEAVIDSFDWLKQAFPKAKIIYKPGNHEFRLPRYFIKHAPELAETPLASMETLLGFEERNIEFLDYFQIVMAGKLPIIHGHEVRVISRAVNPARGLFLKTKTFSACSHCHSTSIHTATNIHGEMLTTWSFGCLCDLNPDYNPYGTDWNWGFAVINIEKDGNFEVLNRRVLDNGKVV